MIYTKSLKKETLLFFPSLISFFYLLTKLQDKYWIWILNITNGDLFNTRYTDLFYFVFKIIFMLILNLYKTEKSKMAENIEIIENKKNCLLFIFQIFHLCNSFYNSRTSLIFLNSAFLLSSACAYDLRKSIQYIISDFTCSKKKRIIQIMKIYFNNNYYYKKQSK
jgi:hypothetical protein